MGVFVRHPWATRALASRQPGRWQAAACRVGIQNLIMAAYDGPGWEHGFLRMLQPPERSFMESTIGTKNDVVELGGSDASSTVISPAIFDETVARYDAEGIAAAHRVGLRVVYCTCGGMMPLLEPIGDMASDVRKPSHPEGWPGTRT
jgi:hypothetical protein